MIVNDTERPPVDTQQEKFLAAARSHDTDESEQAFEEKLKRLGKLKPEKEPNK